jgi:DNA helicase-2/ATP-dependent DNA helicase PcrA
MKIDDLFVDIPVTKIFGTAGAGKTTKLIDILNDLFEKGVEPERIVFASFTKKAVEEMIERVLLKFTHFNKSQFKYFKTIHALGYASSDNKKIMGYKELSSIAKSLGLEISFVVNPEDCGGDKKGDKVVTIESLSRLRMVSLEEQWITCDFDDVSLFMANKWKEKLVEFKNKNNFVDFTDLLQNYNGGAIDADYMIIDEAQDLCPLQWSVLNEMSKKCKRVYIAGDDDQLIYKWAGAEVEYILNIKSDEEIILSKSYRLPANIYNLSREVLRKIRLRKPKECVPTKENGEIRKIGSIEDLVFENNKQYLILIRNKFINNDICEYLEGQGLPYISFNKSSVDCDELKAVYIWESYRKTRNISVRDYDKCANYSSTLSKYDKNNIPEELFEKTWFQILNLIAPKKTRYFRLMLSKGYKLSKEPNIKVSTIHQAKGGECDNVILITDVSFNTYNNINTDDEHRVWYVAVSRAKQNLTIVNGSNNRYYRI